MRSKEQKTNLILRPGDLAPRGTKYTIKGDYSFNEAFEHIYYNGIGVKQRKK
jgi:hypothetical protein